MNQHELSALRKELEHSFGRKILSSRDCLLLVDDIYHKTGYTINANTLRRFFGLVKTNYSASPSTVIILLKYCGFDSVDQIGNLSAPTSTPVATDTTIKKEEVMHYLISLFKNIRPAGHSNIAEAIVQQTIIFLERNHSMIDRFQREIAKTDAGLYYYYELSVNMDRLNDYYGNGLRYYQRANDTNETKMFVHSLQVFRYWLTENQPLLDKHMAELSAIPVNLNYPSHILGRLIAARLLYAMARNEPIDRILMDATKYHVAIMTARGNSTPSFPDFELSVSEALILINHHEEAVDYIKKGKSFFTGFKGSVPKHPFSFWEGLINNNRNSNFILPDASRKNTIHNSLTYPQNKRYSTLLLLCQNPRVRPAQLASLIKETGFTRFRNLYTRKVENS